MTKIHNDELPSASDLGARALSRLRACGVPETAFADELPVRSPVNGQRLISVRATGPDDADVMINSAHEAFLTWRITPAPVRGALVKRLGELFRTHRDDLAELISVEVGKITSEAQGEVQEMIDICDFAVGLSRQLYGRTMPSERRGHRLMETWHPLGVVGVISAFNFPAAVWAWNAAVALVCGDSVVWKPSDLTPLTALACGALFDRASADVGAPPGLNQILYGGVELGGRLTDNPLVQLVSATGSVRMGQAVGPRVQARFGRVLLELGGNNAAVVGPSADLDLTTQSVLFSAVGTAGQRCTTTRRLIVHESVVDELTERLTAAYRRLPIGNPFHPSTLVGPLVHGAAYVAMTAAVQQAEQEGGQLLLGNRRLLEGSAPDAFYVEPALVRIPQQSAVVREETFAPILYILSYRDLDEAIALNNAVPQGLSSSIFTQDQREAERFIGPDGSDCGIVNVNIGTSGAEIGGSFGGEKQTGGGRESGSDSWRAYMRQTTNTVNHSRELSLAQNVAFTI